MGGPWHNLRPCFGWTASLAVLGGLACAPTPSNGVLFWDGSTTRTPPVANADADIGDRAMLDQPSGSGGAAGEDAAGDTAPVVEPPDARPGSGSCMLKVSVLTRTTNTAYAPRNVGAIWIVDGAGKFVKSLNVWGNRRLSHLNNWAASTRAAGVPNNRVDAVTAATLSNHGVRSGTWNCTGANASLVPDGPYKVCFELNESNGTPADDCVSFNKSSQGQSLRPADVSSFTMRMIAYLP
jgi:hypothetical protein